MRRPLTTLTQLVFRPFLVLTLIALGLGRLAPTSSPRRVVAPACQVLVYYQPWLSWLTPNQMLWLDVETGETTRVPLGGVPVLQAASISPWRDERGRSQVVSFRCQGINKGAIMLERASFPDGEVLDSIETEVFPSGSKVCWFPGTDARVLFIGGDKRLYQFAFEFEGDARAGHGRAARESTQRAQPLIWKGRDPRSDGG